MSNEREDSSDEIAQWTQPVAQAVHDQRGLLSNLVVLVSLLRREGQAAGNARLLDLVGRLDNSLQGLNEICESLHIFTERATEELRSSSVAVAGLFADGDDWEIDGPDLTVVAPTRGAEDLLATLTEAGRLLSDSDSIDLRVRTDEAFAVFCVTADRATSIDPVSLLDGTWQGISAQKARGLPLRIFVTRQTAELLGGSLAARSDDGELLLELRLPLA